MDTIFHMRTNESRLETWLDKWWVLVWIVYQSSPIIRHFLFEDFSLHVLYNRITHFPTRFIQHDNYSFQKSRLLSFFKPFPYLLSYLAKTFNTLYTKPKNPNNLEAASSLSFTSCSIKGGIRKESWRWYTWSNRWKILLAWSCGDSKGVLLDFE